MTSVKISKKKGLMSSFLLRNQNNIDPSTPGLEGLRFNKLSHRRISQDDVDSGSSSSKLEECKDVKIFKTFDKENK
jgi:hypothetical protein